MVQMAKTDPHKDALFLSVLERYGDMIRRICFMYASANADFDDLYQEATINIWRGMDSFRGQALLSTWIYRTTVNSCISWIRGNNRHTNGHVDLDHAAQLVVGDDTEHQDRLKSLYQMIATLDPLEKALVMLWLDGYAYAEIAQVTGIAEGNVAVKLHRIKTKLKKLNS